MIDEMNALEHSGTWEFIPLPRGKNSVGCRWVYAFKVGLTCKVKSVKACLVVK